MSAPKIYVHCTKCRENKWYWQIKSEGKELKCKACGRKLYQSNREYGKTLIQIGDSFYYQ